MSRLFSALMLLALMSDPLSAPILPSAVAQAAPAASNTQVTIKTLADKLAGLGSFQAEYDAVSPENKVGLLMLVNQQRRYALTQINLAGDPVRWLVLDYSSTAIPQGMVILMVTEDGIQRFPMPFDRIMQDLDNPVGALRFLSEQIAGAKLEPVTGPGAITLHLGLTATDLNLSMAMNTRPGPMTASWLQEADKATVSEWADGSLKLLYPEQREVYVDGSTGLLQLDRWPNPAKPGTREVRLVRQGAIKQDIPYQELIPGFKEMHVEPATHELITPQFYGGMLAEIEPKTVPALNPESEKQLVQAARARYRQQLGQDPDFIKSYLEQQFKPAFAIFLERNPGQTFTFAQFLGVLTEAIEREPGSVILPGVPERLEKLEAEFRQALGAMQEDKAEKLGEIYSQGRRALVDAWSLEMLAAIAKLPPTD